MKRPARSHPRSARSARRPASPATRPIAVGQPVGLHQQRRRRPHTSRAPGAGHRHHRHPQRHRLHQRQPEALVQRRVHQRRARRPAARTARPGWGRARRSRPARPPPRRPRRPAPAARGPRPRPGSGRRRPAGRPGSCAARCRPRTAAARRGGRRGAPAPARPGPARAGPRPPRARSTPSTPTTSAAVASDTHTTAAARAGGAAVGAQGQPAPGAAVVAAHAGEGHVVHGDHLRRRDPAAVRGQRVVHHVGRRGPGRPGQAAVQPELVQRGVGGAAQRVAGAGRQPPALGRLHHLDPLGAQRAHQLLHVDRGARRPAPGVRGVDQHPHRGPAQTASAVARACAACWSSPVGQADRRLPAQLVAGPGQVRGGGARLAAVGRRRRQPRGHAQRRAQQGQRLGPAWPGGRRRRCRWRPGARAPARPAVASQASVT